MMQFKKTNGNEDLCEINTHIKHASTHASTLPCSVLVVWPRYQTAPHSFQTHWSSIRCLHQEDRCLSERLHISYLVNTHENITHQKLMSGQTS